MDFDENARTRELRLRLEVFMDEHVYPNEERFFRESMELGPWAVWPVVEELKPRAREAGLWNLFLPESKHGAGLTNLEYAPLCEVMGRSHLAPATSITLDMPRNRHTCVLAGEGRRGDACSDGGRGGQSAFPPSVGSVPTNLERTSE